MSPLQGHPHRGIQLYRDNNTTERGKSLHMQEMAHHRHTICTQTQTIILFTILWLLQRVMKQQRGRDRVTKGNKEEPVEVTPTFSYHHVNR